MTISNVYAGDQPKNYRNKVIKVGETGDKTPARRNSKLCKEHTNWKMRYYLPLYDATKNERLVIEAEMRLALERTFPELTPFGNDHFMFTSTVKEHKEQANKYELFAMNKAIEVADRLGVEHGEIMNANFKNK